MCLVFNQIQYENNGIYPFCILDLAAFPVLVRVKKRLKAFLGKVFELSRGYCYHSKVPLFEQDQFFAIGKRERAWRRHDESRAA